MHPWRISKNSIRISFKINGIEAYRPSFYSHKACALYVIRLVLNFLSLKSFKIISTISHFGLAGFLVLPTEENGIFFFNFYLFCLLSLPRGEKRKRNGSSVL